MPNAWWGLCVKKNPDSSFVLEFFFFFILDLKAGIGCFILESVHIAPSMPVENIQVLTTC